MRSTPRTTRPAWRAGTARALTTGATVGDVRALARPHPRRHRRAGAAGRAAVARQAALGHRLSGQGHQPAGGEALMTRFATSIAFAAAGAAAARRLRGIGDDDRADRQPLRHPGLAGARARRAADRAQLRLPRRLDPGRCRTSPAPPTSPPTCSTRAPAISTARPITSGWKTTPSSSASRSAATISAARCARSTNTATRPSICCISR